MLRGPPRSTRSDTLLPYTTLVRSVGLGVGVTVTGPPPNVPPSPPPHDASISAASVTAAIGRLDLAIKLLPRFDPFSSFCLRSEEHTSELQSLMRISYAVFCLKKKQSISIST